LLSLRYGDYLPDANVGDFEVVICRAGKVIPYSRVFGDRLLK